MVIPTRAGRPSRWISTRQVKRFEEHFAKLAPELADVDFVDAGLVRTAEQLAAAKAAFQNVDGIWSFR